MNECEKQKVPMSGCKSRKLVEFCSGCWGAQSYKLFLDFQVLKVGPVRTTDNFRLALLATVSIDTTL